MLACLHPTADVQRLRQTIDLLDAQLAAMLRCWRQAHGNGPIPLSDRERARIAELARPLGWRALHALRLTLIVTAGSIRRWHRRLVERARPRPRPPRSRGRPPLPRRIRSLVCRLARANPTWGYDRIRDALANLGIAISDQSVGNILADHRIPPAGERGRRSRAWRTCVAAHWRTLAAADFASIPVVTLGGFRWVRVLLVMRLATRELHVAAVTAYPDSTCMCQVARNLTMAEVGFLAARGITHLIHDGDGAFRLTGFIPTLAAGGVTCIRIPPGSPNCNAHIERCIRSLQDECTDRLHCLGEAVVRTVVRTYVDHFNHERPHQGIAGRIIDPGPEVGRTSGRIRCRSRLGGMLHYYYREAA